MKVHKVVAAALAGAVSLVPCAGAFAHIGVPEVATAGKTQYVTLQVGHGCTDEDTGVKSDTVSLDVTIPSEVTAAKPVTGFFGYATVGLNQATKVVEKITYSKPNTDAQPGDSYIYEVRLRIAVPNAPFTTLYFPTVQTCRTPEGVEYTNQWTVTATSMPEGGEEAPHLNVLPARGKGWNKFTVPADITELASFFADAEIVWSGDAAFSANPTIAELIAEEEGVTALETIEAGAEIWVKY